MHPASDGGKACQEPVTESLQFCDSPFLLEICFIYVKNNYALPPVRPLTIWTQRRYVLVTNGGTDPRDPDPVKPGRRSLFWLTAAIFVLAVCAFAGSALAPGGSSHSTRPFAVSELASKSTPNPLAGRLRKVYGTNTPASRYGTEVADLEDYGTNPPENRSPSSRRYRPAPSTHPSTSTAPTPSAGSRTRSRPPLRYGAHWRPVTVRPRSPPGRRPGATICTSGRFT